MLAYRTALLLDVARHDADPKARERAQRWCALVTPVLKAACTQQAFQGASECLQVFGGHGYVREWGIEQIVRDARVTMIYEGTNEIQAIDLLVRKVLPDGGAGMSALLVELRDELEASRDIDADAQRRLAQLRYLTTTLAMAAAADPALPYEVADDYLRVVMLTLLAWAWARIDVAARRRRTPRWAAPGRGLPPLGAAGVRHAARHRQAGLRRGHARRRRPDRRTPAPSVTLAPWPDSRTQTPSDRTAPRRAPDRLDTRVLEALVGYNARRAWLVVIEVFAERMAAYGLKQVDFSVLSLLAHNPGATSRQLCATLDILPPNLVSLVAAMDSRGLIERRPHPRDGRAIGLHLTAAGEQAGARGRADRDAAGGWTPAPGSRRASARR